jgi:glycolate oxidase FAD binding subunit
MLAFEPPLFGPKATLGGVVACGLSGPRRPFTGAVRDFVLGCTLVNGRAEILKFGGQVMKNVAGYDVSRLMAGAMGTLGLLLTISLKVLPKPQYERTLRYDMEVGTAITTMNQWVSLALPLSAQCYYHQQLYIRLSGAESAVMASWRKLGGEIVPNDFWQSLSQHRLDFFQDSQPLWRLSLPPNTPPLALSGQWLLDWGGAQRWLKTDVDATTIFQAMARLQGQATSFRHGQRERNIFQPLSQKMLQLQKSLKDAFDPHGIFNPQRLYREI